MSYFPEDIPFMSKEELRENGIRIPKDVPDTNVGDTISRHAAIDALDCINGVEEVLRSLPPAQPEQRTGKWIKITKGAMREKYMCSVCGRTIEEGGIERLVPIKYPFCHCGAKMKGDAE